MLRISRCIVEWSFSLQLASYVLGIELWSVDYWELSSGYPRVCGKLDAFPIS